MNNFSHHINIEKDFLVSDILSSYEKKKRDFENGTITIPDVNKKKTYEVMICELEDNCVLLKPIKPYYCYVFENLFGFDFRCCNFDLNKTIKVKLPN